MERRALAKRNTAYARGFADFLGLFVPPPELEEDGPAGEAARKMTGEHFNATRAPNSTFLVLLSAAGTMVRRSTSPTAPRRHPMR